MTMKTKNAPTLNPQLRIPPAAPARRVINLQSRVTADELAAIDAVAAAHGITRSEMVRQSVLIQTAHMRAMTS